jgi:transposase-like protein
MSRPCVTCQHLKRADIDRRLAAGEPSSQIARDYEVNPSSLYRHRANCLKLGPSNAIKKEAARGSAAVALLPSRETLSASYSALSERIGEIVAQAEQQGSLAVAITGLNSIRQTLDSQARLAGHTQAGGTQVNVAVQTNVNVNAAQIAKRLIQQFDHEPELKERIAQALVEMDDE